jgi:hypothetical protein
VEHQGRDFELVFWGKPGRAAFDHAQTGFVLQGRHASLTCESCHRPRRLHDAAALARGGVNTKRTFLGLSQGCASCHADPHRGQFAPRGCTDCHDQERWTPPARFDHRKTAFPLTGAHAPVPCASCHAPAAGGATRFKGTPHQTCASCHRDPHAGRMGPSCDSCHSTAAWTRIQAGRFDHGRTRFPLSGLHQRVACGACHARGSGGGMKFQGLAFQTCASCHADPHDGRLGSACATCHTTAGWARVQPGRFDHERTSFPLRGKHAQVECDSCHRPGRPRRMPHAACTDCHADRHAGQLAGRADGGCETCHDVAGFEPARFSPEDHAKTRLPLTGAHLAVPCDACHREVPLERLRALGIRPPPLAPSPTEQLRFASTGCAECHADPHRGQTARLGTCESCHTNAAWSAVTFDHARTGFPLAGAHASTPCRGCHPADGGAPTFAGRSADCAACHRDPHGGQFARDGRTDCARCHEPASWKKVRFDHDRDTSFPLQGAHRAVACASCHLRPAPAGSIMVFKGIGKACSDCHGSEPKVPSR